MRLWLLRTLVVAAGLAGWFWTQRLIARRPLPADGLGDRIHVLTARLHRHLLAHPRQADRLLIVTSAAIDATGLFLLGSAILGPSFRPFLGLLLLFGLRQLAQGLCALPPPPGMIWRHPGFPSLLVTYGTANDLFFSGHTAIAVFGGLELASRFGPAGIAAGALLALGETATVLVLRAHYTMDVLAGALAALWVWSVAATLAPAVDAALAALAR